MLSRHQTRSSAGPSPGGELFMVPVALVASALVATVFSRSGRRSSSSETEINNDETTEQVVEEQVDVEEFQKEFTFEAPASEETDDETAEGEVSSGEEASLPQEEEEVEADEVPQLTVLEAAPEEGGAYPPLTAAETWQEVAQQCKTRKPEDADSCDCPCGTKKTYSDCCSPYHQGTKAPESPLQVLQSRYTAFKFRHIEHIIETTHPEFADWREDKMEWVKELNKKGMFDNYEFVSLEPGEEEIVSDTEAYVTFQVKMRSNGQERLISERSKFLKGENGQWMYASGEAKPVPTEKSRVVSTPPRTPKKNKMSKVFGSFKKSRSPKSVATSISGASDTSSQADESVGGVALFQ